MDILSGLLYWSFIIFLQFAPLDTMTAGTDVYYDYKTGGSLHFSVSDAKEQDGVKTLTINGDFHYLNRFQKKTATVVGRGQSWKLTSLLDEDREMLEQGESLDLLRENEDLALISTDKNYTFNQTGSNSCLNFLSGTKPDINLQYIREAKGNIPREEFSVKILKKGDMPDEIILNIIEDNESTFLLRSVVRAGN